MKGGQPRQRDPVPDPAGLSSAELVSSQEVIVVPWFRGTQRLTAHWISEIYNQFSRKIDLGGKK